MVTKILRSLLRRWEPKIAAIQEAKNLSTLTLDDLRGSLITHKLNFYNRKLQKNSKNSRAIALKCICQEESDDEDTSSEDEDVKHLAKSFKEFSKWNKKGGIHFRKMEKKYKKKAMITVWESEDESFENERKKVANLCLMAICDEPVVVRITPSSHSHLNDHIIEFDDPFDAFNKELTPSRGECDPICSVDDTSSQEFEATYQPKTDFLKALAVLAAAGTGAVAINHSWVAANQNVAMAILFGLGYAGIIFEESLAFNKSGVGLLMAVSLWVIRSIGAPSTDIAVSELSHASAEVSEIVFFLLGAMTIVEIVDAHQGFKLVTDNITTRKPRTLLWVVGFVTFFLSSVLDNLTSTIVMVSLLRKLVPPSEYRKILGAVVVIAANAGGAWTPIGDVTTTMLWIHGQISTLETMKGLVFPSVVSLAVPLALMSLTSEVNGKEQDSSNTSSSEKMAPRGLLVFSIGFGALVFVPVFKALTGLPPYMGMLLGLGVLWIVTDAIHYGEPERQQLKVPQALSRIDTQGALFFLGILLSVSSLESAGILREIANYLDAHIPNIELIASAIGVVSAIIDNVPLVAATMGMYDLTSFPQDSEFWQLVAFCAGTGGSMLVIGSAAGVAFMGMEKVDFFWYLRKVSGFAFAGYASGIAAYLAVHNLHLSLPTTVAQIPFLSGS